MKDYKQKTKHDIFDVESLLIPETLIRTSMKTTALNRYLKVLFGKKDRVLIYRYNGVRYLFMDDDFVVEEVLKK